MITPGEWKYGVREDGSMWLSLGNPKTGPHYQGDLSASKEDADLIIVAQELADALKECADDLEAELKARYPIAHLAYPSQKLKYDRDMEPVLKARAALQKAGVA